MSAYCILKIFILKCNMKYRIKNSSFKSVIGWVLLLSFFVSATAGCKGSFKGSLTVIVIDQQLLPMKGVSIRECLENSDYKTVLKKITGSGDILHTNTIEVLNGKLAHKSPAFKQGNVLISIL